MTEKKTLFHQKNPFLFHSKGFVWTLELIITIFLFTMLWFLLTPYSSLPPDPFPEKLCQDLVGVWSYGKDIAPILPRFNPYTIHLSTRPFSSTFPNKQNSFSCHGTRIRNGIPEEIFILVE